MNSIPFVCVCVQGPLTITFSEDLELMGGWFPIFVVNRTLFVNPEGIHELNLDWYRTQPFVSTRLSQGFGMAPLHGHPPPCVFFARSAVAMNGLSGKTKN